MWLLDCHLGSSSSSSTARRDPRPVWTPGGGTYENFSGPLTEDQLILRNAKGVIQLPTDAGEYNDLVRRWCRLPALERDYYDRVAACIRSKLGHPSEAPFDPAIMRRLPGQTEPPPMPPMNMTYNYDVEDDKQAAAISLSPMVHDCQDEELGEQNEPLAERYLPPCFEHFDTVVHDYLGMACVDHRGAAQSGQARGLRQGSL